MENSGPFDKFIDDLLIKQAAEAARRKRLQDSSETPQREYDRRYMERATNRIFYKGER